MNQSIHCLSDEREGSIYGEDSVLYDKEDPPMKDGTIYASMNAFRDVVQQHAIKGQFELATEKSCKDLFRGHYKAEGCERSLFDFGN